MGRGPVPSVSAESVWQRIKDAIIFRIWLLSLLDAGRGPIGWDRDAGHA